MSDTPRTDAAIDSVEGGMHPDGTDGVTLEEDALGKLTALCRQLERELSAQSSREKALVKAARKVMGPSGGIQVWALEKMIAALEPYRGMYE